MWLAALFCAALPLAQEPTPPAPATPPQGSEHTVPEAAAVMEEIQRLVGVVRDGFRKVDQDLRGARDLAEGDAPPELPAHLKRATADADQLLADMEELLKAIPETPSPQDGGQGQKPQDRNPSSGRKPRDRRPKPDSPQDGQSGNQDAPSPQESRDGKGKFQLPIGARSLFDPRSGAWGMLPPRLQQALENAAVEDLPLRYRRWLEEFHRRAQRP